jgi:hypothetical protein
VPQLISSPIEGFGAPAGCDKITLCYYLLLPYPNPQNIGPFTSSLVGWTFVKGGL